MAKVQKVNLTLKEDVLEYVKNLLVIEDEKLVGRLEQRVDNEEVIVNKINACREALNEIYRAERKLKTNASQPKGKGKTSKGLGFDLSRCEEDSKKEDEEAILQLPEITLEGTLTDEEKDTLLGLMTEYDEEDDVEIPEDFEEAYEVLSKELVDLAKEYPNNIGIDSEDGEPTVFVVDNDGFYGSVFSVTSIVEGKLSLEHFGGEDNFIEELKRTIEDEVGEVNISQEQFDIIIEIVKKLEAIRNKVSEALDL